MTAIGRQRAESEQLRASDPGVSAFVSASAGSGKTKLLIDRLLRLMLAGAAPSRIQCLTYTRAAAAEMALRLNAALGKWVTLPDEALAAELARLSVASGAEALARARRLFAEVLDLPGGMRIGTIHAFCQSLLRRFPLEAEISPHFDLAEPGDARAALDAAREDALSAADTDTRMAAIETLATLIGIDEFAPLVAALHTDRARMAKLSSLDPPALLAAQRRVLGVLHPSADAVRAEAVVWREEKEVQAACAVVAGNGAGVTRRRAQQMLAWLRLSPAERSSRWEAWEALLLRQDGWPLASSTLVNEKLAAIRPDVCQCLVAEAERAGGVADALRALRMAGISASLVALATPVISAYAARKQHRALLDYDDLIVRTAALLHDPGAAWVLYKLDGGIDHVLLDEVQDTAPAQWRIADSLTAEFFAGTGARNAARDGAAGRRSVFAVGDRKQSIYSFQGAEPEEFDLWRGVWRERVRSAGETWRDVELDVSFRSTTPVLELVDAVFCDPAAAAEGVVEPGKILKHFPTRIGQAGSVELWPLAPLPDEPDLPAWTVADRNMGQTSAPGTAGAGAGRLDRR